MVPDKFNMVDMGGIDLIMMQGEAVPGLYDKLMAAISNCQYQCLYHWMFDSVMIPPTYVQMTVVDGEVYLNGGVSVTSDDVIHIYTLSPGPTPPAIIPLLAEENGTYNAPSGVDGFDPVTVDVPSYTPVINPITIMENGTYNVPAGVDGYSPVSVNVPGSSNRMIRDVSIITASDIVTEFEALADIATGSATSLQEVGTQDIQKFYRSSASNIIYGDLENADTSATIYAVIRAKTSSGDYGGIVFCHNWNNGTAPMIYTRNNTWITGVYGGDLSSGISSNVFRVLALAVNGTTKIASYYIDGVKIRDNVSFSTSGRHGSWGGGYNYQNVIQAADAFDVLYGSIVRGVETEAEIIANCQAISTAYSNYIGT